MRRPTNREAHLGKRWSRLCSSVRDRSDTARVLPRCWAGADKMNSAADILDHARPRIVAAPFAPPRHSAFPRRASFCKCRCATRQRPSAGSREASGLRGDAISAPERGRRSPPRQENPSLFSGEARIGQKGRVCHQHDWLAQLPIAARSSVVMAGSPVLD
jgi:hypothetical protein